MLSYIDDGESNLKVLNKIIYLILFIPVLVCASPLLLENTTQFPLYAYLGSGYIKYMPAHSTAIISEGQFNSACESMPHSCTMLILKNPLNTANDIANILLDVETGILNVEQSPSSDLHVDGSGFHLQVTKVI